MSGYTRFQTEAQLVRAIASNAREMGFLVFHDRIAQGSTRGFPDLLICGHGAVFAVECKGPSGRVKPAQQRWLDELNAAGIDARIAWSTNDDDFDAVMRALEEAYERHFAARAGHATHETGCDAGL